MDEQKESFLEGAAVHQGAGLADTVLHYSSTTKAQPVHVKLCIAPTGLRAQC
jgi:hypothetical protein